ncbi:MAG: hypothetical protein C0514_05435 [Candidatus Puniceispirillum sp.]|nr:hypothetical protein [Candidatus Puniceispirillum sp.]
MTFFSPKSLTLFAGLLTTTSLFASNNNNFDLEFLDSETLEALRVANPGVSDAWLSQELGATFAPPVTTTPSAQHMDPAALASILALMVLQHTPTTTTTTPSALPAMPALVPDDADFVPTTPTVVPSAPRVMPALVPDEDFVPAMPTAVPSALPVMPALVPDDEDFAPQAQALPLAPTAPRAPHSSGGYDPEVLASLRALHPGASDQWLMETYRSPAPRASVPPEYIESASSLASLDQEMLASLLLVYPNAHQAWLEQEVSRMAAATQPRATTPDDETAQNGQGQDDY